MAIITLTTDFGTADGFVGVMKGVILAIAPDVRLVDLSHDIPPQGIQQAAYVLARAAPYFPPGTIHLAVVDPGVGSARRPLAVQTGQACYVGPDNGLFTFAVEEAEARAFVLDRPSFWLPQTSHTFHGRDVFAPAAAHLALGRLPAELGSPIADPVRLELPAAAQEPDGTIRGEVAYVDHFGNLITNVPGTWLAGRAWQCEVAGLALRGPSRSYAEAPRGAALILVSSGGTLEIAVRDGSAAAQLAAGAGARVVVRPLP